MLATHLESSSRTDTHELITTIDKQQSGMQTLPTELLLHIDKFLFDEGSMYFPGSSVAKLALRATCRRYRAVLGNPIVPGHCWSIWDRKEYSRMMKLATFRMMCNKERDGTLDARMGEKAEVLDDEAGEWKVCSVCRTCHRALCFTYPELDKTPEKRACLEKQGSLRFCMHNRMSYASLYIRKATRVRRSGWQGLTCRGARDIATARREEVEEVTGANFEILMQFGSANIEESSARAAIAMRFAKWKVLPHPDIVATDRLIACLQITEVQGRRKDADERCGVICTECNPELLTYTCNAPTCSTRVTIAVQESPKRHNARLVFRIESCAGSRPKR